MCRGWAAPRTRGPPSAACEQGTPQVTSQGGRTRVGAVSSQGDGDEALWGLSAPPGVCCLSPSRSAHIAGAEASRRRLELQTPRRQHPPERPPGQSAGRRPHAAQTRALSQRPPSACPGHSSPCTRGAGVCCCVYLTGLCVGGCHQFK